MRDAYTAALAVELAGRVHWRQAAALASGAAALATQRFGALPSLPTRRAVEAFLDGRRAVA